MKYPEENRFFTCFIDHLKRALPYRRPEDPAWIVAFSGGPDSLALCLLLKRARDDGYWRDLGRPRLIAFHVHHGLRGEKSDGDQAFAAGKARELGFEFDTIRLEPPARERRGSTEAWAREARYAALAAAAVKWRAYLVLTAHHKDDQAETVLQRLIRGSEYRGLAGMSVSRPLMPNSNVRLIRPLLKFSRAELETFLGARGERAVLDETNLDTRIQRNRIRLRLLPALERAWPNGSIKDALCEMADAAGKIHRVLDNVAGLVLTCARFEPLHDWPEDLYLPFVDSSSSRKDPNGSRKETPREDVKCVFDKNYLMGLPSLFLYPLLMKTMERLAPGRETRLTRERFRQAHAWLKSHSKDEKTDRTKAGEYALGSGMIMRVDGAEVRLFPQAGEKGIAGGPSPIPITVPGEATLPDDSRLRAEPLEAIRAWRDDTALHDPLIEHVDADRAGEALFIRAREAGDRFHPLGAKGEKKLKSFLIDNKIPEPLRDGLGLLCNDRDVIWVMGLRIHHDYRITRNTRRILRLRIMKT